MSSAHGKLLLPKAAPLNVNQEKITHQRIDDEVVIINLETGTYYSLRGFAAAVWQQIDAGRSRPSIITAVSTSYPSRGDAPLAVDQFIGKLVSEQLVVEDMRDLSDTAAPALPPEFEVPELEAFTDMQELIMIDVIHEVDSRMGWPHKPSDA
jgi:hypothetical protein